MPVEAFNQPDLFPRAQLRNAHLLRVCPPCRPALLHGIPPPIRSLPWFFGFPHTPIPFRLQQPFYTSLQHVSRLPLHLLPGCSINSRSVSLPFSDSDIGCLPYLTPAWVVDFGDTLSLFPFTFNRTSYRRLESAALILGSDKSRGY
jgi:hypothetical protein